ncbi:hypothetical protein F5887DRAFT_890334 [Amanita rubescens]|nr:hypothetical protein F5887DRAFT_890334 [Amanita rubescens]
MSIRQREAYLEEMINHEGRGYNPPDQCPDCCNGLAIYQCRQDCFGQDLLCQACIVHRHALLPFHRVRQWNGKHFIPTSLKALGLSIQLNHRGQSRCLNPETCALFTVIDVDAIHSVRVNFCACGHGAQSCHVQLLRAGLFPVTSEDPKTAITFRTLELFEILSYESKVSIFEYHHTLMRLTDNTGMNKPPDRYSAFNRSIRIWRHLKMLKRTGRGHDPDGVANTKEGECGLLCPACPQPGINLPDGWESAAPEKRWLYSLFLGLDANFRLKRKDVSNDRRDGSLSLGWSYFVPNEPYKEHLAKKELIVVQKSNCSRHDAVNLSSSKPGQSHAATGVGTVECVRHNMKRPNAVGDLQKGERYCNMDYLFYKSLANTKIKDLVISYDIACQWSLNLNPRLERIDPSFPMVNNVPNDMQVRYLVPKFHLPAHVARCRTRYSFNYSKNVGRTDREAPERGWAEINPMASSTKEMGPGFCRDTLDSHFGDYNWRKIINLGSTLLRKMKDAGSEMAEFAQEHQDLERSLSSEVATKWRTEVEAWEADSCKLNPFEHVTITPTQAAVRRELSEQEGRLLAASQDFSLDAEVSPSSFIAMGIGIEAEHNRLVRKINTWGKYEKLYLPIVELLRNDGLLPITMNKKQSDEPFNITVWLPSKFIGINFTFDRRLAEIEWKLRIAEAYGALDGLRHHIQIRTHVYKFKDRFTRGQAANTRALNKIQTINAKIHGNRDKYRAARSALLSLSGALGLAGWQSQLPILSNSDVRGILEGEEGDSDGRKKLSWIWKVMGVSGDEDGDLHLQESLRVEWCKSRARAMRFSEEVELLQEEMERVLRFFRWQECRWRSNSSLTESKKSISTMRAEGLRAYAERQAVLRSSLRSHFAHIWRNVPDYVKLVTDSVAT